MSLSLLVGETWPMMLSPEALAYDPLDVPKIDDVVVVDHDFRYARRDRTIQTRIYTLLEGGERRPVILFSRGLGGTREGSAFLSKHWAARGYFVVALQHPGSDDSVWKPLPQRERLAAMRNAASATNAAARIADVTTILDQLANWNKDCPEWLAKKWISISKTLECQATRSARRQRKPFRGNVPSWENRSTSHRASRRRW